MAKFDAHPYIGNCVLGVTIGTAGDALAQVFFPTELETEDKHTAFDFKRSASIAAYSGVVYPLLTRWYLWQEALCGATQGLGVVLAQKVAMDEFLLAPFFNGGYLSYAAVTSGESVTHSLRENFWDVMYADWLVWPGVMVVCFLKVPVQFRPGYVAFVGVGWNMYLAYKAHAELEEEEAAPLLLVQEPEEDVVAPLPTLGSQPSFLRRTTTNRRERNKQLTDSDPEAGDLSKGFDRVFKSIFPIDLNDQGTLEWTRLNEVKDIKDE